MSYRAALLLAGALVLAGCGVAKEEAASTENVRPTDLERMVKKQHLGPLARGLRLDQDSGPSKNKEGAEDTIDPKDTARALARAGRVRGYDLTYAATAKPSKLGVLIVGEGVELFRTEQAASEYLRKQFADFKRFRGRTVEGVRIVRVEDFDVGTGDEAAGVRMTVRYPSRRFTAFYTVAAFRRGRVVGNAWALLRRELFVEGDVERIADALDDRVERVASGTAERTPAAVSG